MSQRLEELEQILGDVAKNEADYRQAQSDFDSKIKAAATLVDQYMSSKRSAVPVDTVKKLDDFKKSVLEFNNACKGFSKKSKEITGLMGQQKSVLEAKVEDVRANPGDDPDVLKKDLEQFKTDASDAQEKLEKLTKEHEELKETSSKQLQEEMESWSNKLDTTNKEHAAEIERLQREVEDLKARLASESSALEITREKLKDSEDNAAMLQIEHDEAVHEAQEATKKSTFLNTKLDVEEKTRANEFKAYEQATKSHEKDLHGWEERCNELRRQLEAAKLEKEAMRGRLTDEHLREHIRALQVENNNLREEKIVDLHAKASQNALLGAASPMKSQLDAVEKDKKYLEEQVSSLQDRLFRQEKESFELAQKLELATSSSKSKTDELEKKLFMAKIDLEAAQSKAQSDAATKSDETSRKSRSVGVQQDDRERLELEREVIVMRAQIEDMDTDLAHYEKKVDDQRVYFEEKLLHQVKDYESQIVELRNQVKVVNYKNTKLLQELQEAECQVGSASMDAIIAENEVKLDEWRRKVEKRAVAAEMEAQGLQTRVVSLRRELEQQRDHYEGKLTKITDDYNASIQLRSTPRGTSQAAASTASAAPSSSAQQPQQYPQQQYRDPLEVPLRSPSFMDKLQYVDDSLLRIHSEAVALDEKERKIGEQRDASLKKIADRVAYLRSAELFWGREGRTQFGPNGETPEEMLEQTAAEVENLTKQRTQVESSAVLFYKELGESRARLQESSNVLIKQRSDLYKSQEKA